jgi:uncharacterized membrane protein
MLTALLFWPFAFWFFGPFHGLFSLLILILIFSLIFRRRYYYWHPYWWHSGQPGSRADARSILEERYAKGEIKREEYLQMKQDLGS